MIEMTKPKEKIVSRGRVVWASFVTLWSSTVVVLGVIAASINSHTLGMITVTVLFAPIYLFLTGMIILCVVEMYRRLWKWAYEDPSKDDEK